jgi:tetratricopeptide (TPR) repeat protein
MRTSRANLANAYEAVGRIDEAIALFERNLADLERILDPDHPEAGLARINLADAYLDAGRAADAIPLLERTLADLVRIAGPNNPHVLTFRSKLDSARASLG